MKRFIFVAGVDYSGIFKGRGLDFRIFCNNRMKRLVLKNKAKEEMTFQIFDCKRGEVATHVFTYPDGKKTETVTNLTPSPFNSVSTSNYDSNQRFKNGQTNLISALNIYRAVQDIGAATPNTLVELSFFSHGWQGGPILVNSFDDGQRTIFVYGMPHNLPLPSAARDPDDFDPRASKDFITPTMDATALLNFQNAFHSDGYIWIWGCAFPRIVHEILYKIERNSAYRDSGLSDDVLFKIKNFNTQQADYLESFLVHLTGPFADKKNIEIKFKFLKYFFCQMTLASYSHHIAKNANVKVFAAVIGTWSDYDSGRNPLLSISKHAGLAKHIPFYKNYLGFTFDPEDRRYGEYKPNFTCTTPSVP